MIAWLPGIVNPWSLTSTVQCNPWSCIMFHTGKGWYSNINEASIFTTDSNYHGTYHCFQSNSGDWHSISQWLSCCLFCPSGVMIKLKVHPYCNWSLGTSYLPPLSNKDMIMTIDSCIIHHTSFKVYKMTALQSQAKCHQPPLHWQCLNSSKQSHNDELYA
jgi:hypothetical protein